MKIVFLLIIILVAFLVGVFLLSKYTKSNTKNIILAVVSLIILIIGYSMLQNSTENSNVDKMLYYNQGKILVCNDIDVNIKEFNFVSGTMSFVANENSKLKGLAIQIDKCKIKTKKSK